MTDDVVINHILHYRDHHEPAPNPNYQWGRDYGKDLLADLNQMAHARGTDSLMRDLLQRAFREIKRLQR